MDNNYNCQNEPANYVVRGWMTRFMPARSILYFHMLFICFHENQLHTLTTRPLFIFSSFHPFWPFSFHLMRYD